MDITMTPNEVSLLTAFLSCARNYLEFGAGGSTVLASKCMSGPITSIDSSEEWLEKVRDASTDPQRLNLHFANIGPTREWGYPTTGPQELYPSYHEDIWRTVRGTDIDVFLIDGRFRVASFCQAALRANPSAVILCHDYNNRPNYHVVERICRKVASVDNLAIFRPLTGMEADAAHIIKDYYYNPD